jgi:hypothetical protein
LLETTHRTEVVVMSGSRSLTHGIVLGAGLNAVRVRAEGSGRIELSGPILGSDVGDLIGAVHDVQGVTAVVDHLEVHATPEGVPRLQGPPHRHRRPSRVSPALKLAVGAVAAGVAATSLVTGNPLGLVIGGAGVLTIARSLNRHGSVPPGRAARRRLERREARRLSPSEMPSPL